MMGMRRSLFGMCAVDNGCNGSVEGNRSSRTLASLPYIKTFFSW